MRTTRFALALTVGLLLATSAAAQTASRTTAGAATALEPRILRQATFNIPFSVDSLRDPREVQLYVSVDAGQTWKLYDRQPPETRRFQFRAGGDGQFWFASRTIEAGRVAPAVEGRPPELYVVVDTTEPELVFKSTVGSAGEIVSSWRISDLTLDASSMKIEYQAGSQQEWTPVAVERTRGDEETGVLSGTMTWWPQTQSPEITVRAEVADRAGNKTVVTRQLSLPSAAPEAAAGVNWPPPPSRPGVGAGDEAVQTAQRVPLDPYQDIQSPPGGVAWPPDNARAGSTELVGQPTFPTPPPPTADSFGSPTTGSPTNAAAGPSSVDETYAAGGAMPNAVTDPPRGAMAGTRQVSNSSQFLPTREEAPSAPRSYGIPPGERPRMTPSKRFQLEYEIDAVGANGVREVELWGTSDDGRTWTVWQTDPDRQSPLDVEVQNDGVYGFRIVIVGNNGLAGPAPRNGDLADLWVGVDATPPAVDLRSATYGQGEHAGQLDIQWSADDAWLGDRPVTLLFSDRPTGPWTTIAAGIPNTGQYYWPIDPRIPDEIYLRIEVRDEAGNRADEQLRDPISISGLTPKATIRGIRPLEGSERGAFRNPFFR